jgi:hypothetical protein
MRRQLTAYVSEEDFARLKHEAEERRTSLSRHIKERLLESTRSLDPESGAPALFEAEMAAFEKRIIDANRAAIVRSHRPIIEQLNTLVAMVDQFVLSALIHLPEIPEAQRQQAIAAGERRHRGWRLEVEDLLRHMTQPANSNGANGAGNGVHA